MMARDLINALDPVELMRATGLEPDNWQAEVLRSPSKKLAIIWEFSRPMWPGPPIAIRNNSNWSY